MRRIKGVLWMLLFFLCHHPLKSLWLNFKVLPFKQAICLPIVIYSDVEFRSLSGSVVYAVQGKVKPFSIKIGNDTCYPTTSHPKTIWDICGTLILKGPVSFIQGTYILVAEGATLTIGTNGTFIGSDSKIMCFDIISIGNNVEITWECQIYDTSFHYVESEQGVKKLTAPIVIKDNCWIGNRCTIAKGCVLPEYSIVGSGSLVNRDFSVNGSYCMYTGTPAIVKKRNVKRIFDEKQQAKLDEDFNYHRNKL